MCEQIALVIIESLKSYKSESKDSNASNVVSKLDTKVKKGLITSRKTINETLV